MVKNLPANAGDIRDRGSMPGLRREGLEEGTATHSCVLFFFFFHSCILAWRISWTDEPGRLQPMGLERVGYN